MKKIAMKMVSAFLVLAVLFSSASFALDKGSYSMKNETSYVNPATGKTEDGGTQIAIGDGMCRTALGEYFLLDVKSKKQKYLTIRMGLQHFTKDLHIFVKNKKGEYKEVKFKEKAEDKKNHTKDYKFAVNSDYPEIKVKMYVEPMGRDVIFFAKGLEDETKKGEDKFKKQEVATKMKIK
ncbi:heme-binding Shp domain-containing protein [Filifactor villosus]|uniref:Heme-binding Shp domain-containing protein n=1 Tax=Filifactor villosus TaxID=29374 RepID=A0ABV9QLR9_9FIRM